VYNSAERFDNAVLSHNNLDLPTDWVCVRELFYCKFDDIDNTQWALVQPYLLVERKEPLDMGVGCPHVTLEGAGYFVVPSVLLEQVIHVIEDHTSKEPIKPFWVDWWISFGTYTYPERHRFTKQMEYGWWNTAI
jgi:hypothetical protein